MSLERSLQQSREEDEDEVVKTAKVEVIQMDLRAMPCSGATEPIGGRTGMALFSSSPVAAGAAGAAAGRPAR